VRRKAEQVVAANLAAVLVVFAAAQPHCNFDKPDAALLTAAAAGVPVLLCVNKLDLAGPDLETDLHPYRR